MRRGASGSGRVSKTAGGVAVGTRLPDGTVPRGPSRSADNFGMRQFQPRLEPLIRLHRVAENDTTPIAAPLQSRLSRNRNPPATRALVTACM